MEKKTELLILEDYKKNGILSDADKEKIKTAAEYLKRGGLVAFPTETVYGLGGNALNPEAAGAIYAAKGRPSDNPLIVHIAEIEDLTPLVAELPESALLLAEAFWPGPLTMVLAKSPLVPPKTTGGLETVAVRMPSCVAAAELIRMAGLPVAAPSANRSGRPSTTCAEHCMEDLNGRIEAVLDGGACSIGVESTIVDLTSDVPVLLRPGAVTQEMLEAVLHCAVERDPALEAPLEMHVRPKAPGMKYRHYAPKAPMVLVDPPEGAGEEAKNKLTAKTLLLAKESIEKGLLTGILCTDETLPVYEKALGGGGSAENSVSVIRSLGKRSDAASVARNLFSLLREMDDLGVESIVSEGFRTEELGYAIMNRMKKAAAGHIVTA